MTGGGLTLAISTSSPALSLALFDGTVLIGHDHRIIGRGHAEALVPAIAALLAGRRADAIIVDVGPGSFTGIRIGIAAARGLGLAWGVPVTGCTAGGLVAARARAGQVRYGPISVRIDAGRDQIFRQSIADDYSEGAIETVPAAAAGGPADAPPDARFALALPPAARDLAPQARYVRPPDAILPL